MNYLGRNSDGRLPFYSQADLYAQYRLTLGGSKAVTFSANVINLFDQKTANNYYATESYNAAVNGSQDAFYRGEFDFRPVGPGAGRPHGRTLLEGQRLPGRAVDPLRSKVQLLIDAAAG